jgi:hypothetical protein
MAKELADIRVMKSRVVMVMVVIWWMANRPTLQHT